MGRLNSLYVIILIGIFSCGPERYEEAAAIIEQVKKEYAPDSRTALFDVKAIKADPVQLEGETNLPEATNRLISLLESKGLDVVNAIKTLPAEDLGDRNLGLISLSVASLRARPSHSAELVTQALLGTPVKLLKKERSWYLIQTPDKYLSWGNESSIVSMNAEELEDWRKKSKIIYLNTYGFSVDPKSGHRVSDLVAGNILTLKDERDDLWIVEYPDGRIAEVKRNEAADFKKWKNNQSLNGSALSSTALNLMGIPYLWGGTSAKGMDCSGFTKTVYFLHGLVLPRDASQQVQEGELIDIERDFSRLEIGDLLFFGSKNEDQTERVVHVGLWLGDMQFIHASGDIHISSMDSLSENFDRYNYRRYLRTKRIVGSNTVRNALIDVFY